MNTFPSYSGSCMGSRLCGYSNESLTGESIYSQLWGFYTSTNPIQLVGSVIVSCCFLHAQFCFSEFWGVQSSPVHFSPVITNMPYNHDVIKMGVYIHGYLGAHFIA